ncbi:MAG: polysaccharide biosynthesis protein [Tissierellales bacterium]|nr:polysaccharide biosynthesis protein [Tissierellales bacterium]
MQKKIRMLLLLTIDVLTIIMAYYGALWLRFDGVIEAQYYELFVKYIPALIIIKIVIFMVFRLYRSLWEYASIEEMMNICIAVFAANTAAVTYLVLMQESHLPRSVYVMAGVFDLIFVGGVRFVYRALRRFRNKNFLIRRPKSQNVLVVGAGDAGALIVKELKTHLELNYNVVGIIDDDLSKKGHRLNGTPVLGCIKGIEEMVERYDVDEIIIAIPSATREETKFIVNRCKATDAKIKILPGVYELIDGKVTVNQIREVNIEDLLGRDAIRLDTTAIEAYIKGKRIMVTGGGGSIGSELCRQIARFNPEELFIVDIYENNVYELQNELNAIYNIFGFEEKLKLRAIIASVRDKKRMKRVLEEMAPDVIFHAAAHKHVPLMEDNPYEAVKNNIVGTFNMASLAHELGLEKFVLISTDKAVNPTNVMGATKRFCEMIVQAHAKVSETEFVAVRFGNVLGSNGSVIPLFKKQIENGGPVTVTHREIIRYFMTIPEAAQLVLQAGAMAKGGEIFILDMGDPVRIYDLAADLIRLSGFIPDEDIKILITGLRPGEKLYEELLMEEEGLKKTLHEKIHTGKPLDIEYEDIVNKVDILSKTADLEESDLLISELKRFVPTYRDNKELNKSFLETEDVS